jgi:hypothetical protein
VTSLRETVATLRRFSLGEAINIGTVAEFVHMERPVSLNALAAKIAALPPSVTFHSTIETGAALGGEVSITLNRNGSYRFSGFMRATGIPSFSFRIGVVVRSASTQVTVAAQHSGKVFGTDTPGDRQNNWDEVRTDPEQAKFIRNVWPDISAGTMVVSRSSELSGVLGTATDVIKDVAEIFLVAETLGASLAICLVIGSELGAMGASVPGLGGVVGLGIVAGSLYIWGPLAIGPAIIAGVAAGAIIDSMVKIRRLRTEEVEFARQVFGDSLDFDRIRLTNLLGVNSRPFTIPTVDDTILVNIGDGVTFDRPIDAMTRGKPVPGQLLIHELTHAWQIQHASLEDGYVPGWLCKGIEEQVVEGKSAYRYGEPGPSWRSFGVEGQASIVDQWFGGNGNQVPGVLPAGFEDRPAKMNPDSRYFDYIENNIRAGVA